VPPPPVDEAELQQRLRRVAGRTLGALAAADGVAVPDDFRRAKGWVGQLLERTLGATASSRAEPDFPALGIELKTVPVDRRGVPQESTFVATLDLAQPAAHAWETSVVRHKLARVAWVPVEADHALAVADRKVGTGLLWSATAAEEQILRADFEEIVGLIEGGFGEQITGHRGTWLQLRPKGANAASLRWGVDADGGPIRTPGRAFYLRAGFTTELFRRHFQMPPPR
jgi:DNA mismatch repair protein MutH